MQTLTFTPEGFLTPFEKINVDLATFESVFVTDFPNSETRKTLFDNYLRYLDSFSKEITPNFMQWIDGSFVTQKENPNDIDLVTFISRKEYIDAGKNIGNYLSFSLEAEKIDAYILEIYPSETVEFTDYTLKHQNDWYKRFSKTKVNSISTYNKKGFIQLIF
jgi:hypothetical protein